MSDRIAHEIRDLIVSLDSIDHPDNPDVTAEGVLGQAVEMRTTFLITYKGDNKHLSKACLNLVTALANLQVEPTNEAGIILLRREIDLLRNMNVPRITLLASWYLAVALMLQEFPPGKHAPRLSARGLIGAAEQFQHVAEFAVVWGDPTRASLAYSLAAELRVYTGNRDLAIQLARLAVKHDDGSPHELLELRRHNYNTLVINEAGWVRPPMSVDYGTYLYTPGELLAAIDAA